MKRNSSIQVLTILMAVMFLSSGQILAASTSAPKATGVANMVAVSSVVEGMQDVGPDDSVLVISGKVNMGDAAYYAIVVYPYCFFNKNGPSDGTIIQKPVMQLKSNETAGYKVILVFKNTSKNAKMWKFFQEFSELTMKEMMMNVKRTKEDAWKPILTYTPSLPKTYPVGPVQPK